MLLVVVIVLTGLPILMGMAGMAPCPDCGPTMLAGANRAMTMPAALALLLALSMQRLRSRAGVMRFQLHPFLPERPPRLA